MDETNNSKQQELKEIIVTYPDLIVENVRTSLTGSIVPQGTNVVLFASIKNVGKADANVPNRATSIWINGSSARLKSFPPVVWPRMLAPQSVWFGRIQTMRT
jgi:subtilase family serine protease